MSFIDDDQVELVPATGLTEKEIDSYFFENYSETNRQFLVKELYPRINSGVFHNNPAEDLYKTHITFYAELVLIVRRIPDNLLNVDANL